MMMFMTKPAKLMAPVLFCAAFGFAQPANAVTYIDIIWSDGSTTVGEVDCGGLCEGFTEGGTPLYPDSMGVLDPTFANFYDLTNGGGGQSVENETQALNILITGVTTDPATTPFAASDGTKSDMDFTGFPTDAEYLAMKLGVGTYFFHISSLGAVINVSYDYFGGPDIPGAGGSHFTEWGMSVIPLPAALPMFLASLGGLFWVGRRRRRGVAGAA